MGWTWNLCAAKGAVVLEPPWGGGDPLTAALS